MKAEEIAENIDKTAKYSGNTIAKLLKYIGKGQDGRITRYMFEQLSFRKRRRFVGLL